MRRSHEVALDLECIKFRSELGDLLIEVLLGAKPAVAGIGVDAEDSRSPARQSCKARAR
jgi:hypothetical protein